MQCNLLLGTNAVEAWASERNDIIENQGLFPFTDIRNSRGEDIGHWTAMIWDETDKVSHFKGHI